MTLRRMVRFHQRGSLSIELMVAVGVMAALLNVLVILGNSFRKVQSHRWAKHTLMTAGQAQMDALTVTGKPIETDTFERLWPDVQCRVEISDGRGHWQGLEKVQVHLSVGSRGRLVTTDMIRYLSTNQDGRP